jgi:hypothetical protein
VVEYLLSKRKALSSDPSTAKKKKKYIIIACQKGKPQCLFILAHLSKKVMYIFSPFLGNNLISHQRICSDKRESQERVKTRVSPSPM